MLLTTPNAIALFRFLFLVSVTLSLPSCGETPSPAKSQNVGFAADITGAHQGEVSGAGILVLLPDAGFDKQGYFFLADGRGIRPYGVTFLLPRGTAPGKHELGNPSPFEQGNVPSVRVDRDMGDAVLSFEKSTSGFLELTAFPDAQSEPSESSVAGNFEFETENSLGQRITVKGVFSFNVE